MFEKIIKFGCGFIVISIVAWICFVVISSVYLSAGLASNHKEDRAPEITMMSAPKTLHISKFKVDEVLEDGSAVAHVEDLSSDFSSDISFGGEVLFQNDGTDSYVNNQIITAPKGKVEQIGTCKFSGNTIPVIRIIK